MASKTTSDNFDPIGLNSFYGGMSVDSKLGTNSQFYYARHIDFRKNPSNFSVLPQPTKADNGVVSDLVQDMTQITSGARFAVGNLGNLYQINTSNTWLVSNIGENGGAGIIFRSDVDNVYITGQTKVARINRVSGSAPAQQYNWFTDGPSTCTTCTQKSGMSNYTTPLAITESALNKRNFTTDIEPISRLAVYVNVIGTGDLTLTLHDDANNVIGTKTVTHVNVVIGKNYFTFATPLRVQRGDNGDGSALTYHFHVTSTVADTTLSTNTINSLATADMELWASALASTQNGLHPIMDFANLTLIGNGRYVVVYEPLQDNPTTADFERHRLTFPPGFEVCGFAQKNLFAVIGAEKRSTNGEFQEGALFFWDGVSETYNDWWPVPEGSPESLYSSENTVWFTSNGVLYKIQGTDQPIKVRTIRNTDSEYSGVSDITHVYPNMMTVRRGILLVGYPSITTNQSIEHGIYSYGAISQEYPLSWGFSYTTSNGNILNTDTKNLRLGMVKSYGDTLYVSWRDDSVSPHAYGVDVVDNTSAPASTFTITSLLFDDNRAYAHKNAGYMICTFDSWPADATLTLKYKLDNDSDFTYSTTTVTTGDQYLVMPIDRRFLVGTFGADGTCGTTTPNISSLFVWVDPLSNERPIGG